MHHGVVVGQRVRRSAPMALAGKLPRRAVMGCLSDPFGPEALGSPAGYSVPPAQTLLRPHPSLWRPSAGLLFFVRRTLGTSEGPNFYLPVLSSVPSALPRRIRWWLAVLLPPVLPSTLFDCLGIRKSDSSVHVGGVTRLHHSLYATARKIVRPAPKRAFTFELSSHESPRWNVEHRYAGTLPIPAVGLSPTGQAALLAVAKGHEEERGG